MSDLLTDSAIAELLAERKPAISVPDLVPRKVRDRHVEAHHEFVGDDGSRFRLTVRQLLLDPLDFSVVLMYSVPGTSRQFRLRRCNGDSHLHTNKIERNVIDGFHVHTATERYQAAGFKEDDFAEPTDAYAELFGAIRHMLRTASFDAESQEEMPI